ncbi:DUF2894 domain-containing protein [Dechloromonas sp. ZY10]|uniref:DUF2894 domain-containing protein n=1 Tax=Dechloromonas aquae TaxID=2664436 RepID=UPI0035281650
MAEPQAESPPARPAGLPAELATNSVASSATDSAANSADHSPAAPTTESATQALATASFAAPSPAPGDSPAEVFAQAPTAAPDNPAARLAPLPYARRQALSRLAEAQPGIVQERLQARLQALTAQIEQMQAAATAPPPAASATAVAEPASPLAELLAYIGEQALPDLPFAEQKSRISTVDRGNSEKSSAPLPIGQSTAAPELKAVAYFRDAWSRLSTEQQLTQTLAQAPENAGPMNSQHLVLRSLQVMREVAPDYLQGFMSYIDTLIWLEQVDPTRIPAKAAGESDKKPRSSKRPASKRQA